MRTLLVTVADDRSGRKGGQYTETQDKVAKYFSNYPTFGLETKSWTWSDIIKTNFYLENKAILDNQDPAMNGRCYKPFIVLEGLKSLDDGDFLIYNDASPNLWLMIDKPLDLTVYSLDVIKNLCTSNGGILTPEVVWGVNDESIGHTHENFTLNRCMETMGLLNYQFHLQHAGGLMVLQKSNYTMDFVTEWLYWNAKPECSALGPSTSSNCPFENCACKDNLTCYSYWTHEVNLGYGKIGHRHDQSVSGLLINRLGKKLLCGLNTFCFLEACIIGKKYEFVETNRAPSRYKYKWDHVNNTMTKIER